MARDRGLLVSRRILSKITPLVGKSLSAHFGAEMLSDR
jgi:hypothetical protein